MIYYFLEFKLNLFILEVLCRREIKENLKVTCENLNVKISK